MKQLKRLSVGLLVFVILAMILSVVLVFVPVRQRSVAVPKGFHYGEVNNQSTTTENATFMQKWYGFPATVAEKQTIIYKSGTYESVTYEVQKLSLFYVVVNIVFWMSLVVALLSPFMILHRSHQKTIAGFNDSKDEVDKVGASHSGEESSRASH